MLTLAGCAGGDEQNASRTDGVVIAPGSPGDEPQVLSEAPTIRAVKPNAADVTFAADMVVHHAQALEMAALAPNAGGSDAVRRLAARIDAAQRPEVLELARWLDSHDEDVPRVVETVLGDDAPGHGSHGSGHGSHADMPGMATTAEMQSLARARGVDFDRQFLTLMIAHHRGALAMVDDVVVDGVDQRMGELAAGIAADQTAEIARMQGLLAGL